MCNWKFTTGWLLVLLTGNGLAWAQHGATRGVHDPVMIRENDAYYVFSSGAGIPVRRSKDMLQWKQIGRVFDEDVPAWAKKEIPQAQHVWAPDISYYNNRFHLYYSVSTLGSQRSCIGLATNKTLDPSSGEYKWVDHGKVIESFPGKLDYNAIDPNLVLDEHGNPWLVWGSFWGGIKLMRLNIDTGKPLPDGRLICSLAARPRRHAIEAPFLVRKNAYYYLFVSFDHCCRGVASNYKIMVGRSREIAGPYVDFDGQPLRDGGGTIVLAGYGEWRGPGHNGILLDANGDWLVHHMYDARRNGTPTMQIRPLIWGRDGWPVVGEPIAPRLPMPPLQASDLLGAWKHSVNFGAEDYLEFLPQGRMNSAVDQATWSLDGALLKLRWPDPAAPGGAWIDTCHLAPDGRSYVGRNQKGFVIRGTRSPEQSVAPR
ncbi:MAG: arabinan endo-1,5-alpha-L-arabinosidase [Phycisphaerales bacterium]|nr:MAG: arabinan endo-1,5-alpha-L-arabinosidase [Phycisphaerales bacterium]